MYARPMDEKPIRLTDQVANGTMSQEIADLLRETARAHKSFLVMAVPRLAGKTTTMRSMLAEQSAAVLTLGYDGEDVDPLVERAKGGYLVVPEIARGKWSAGYVWGEPVRRAFNGITQGTALATALHVVTGRFTTSRAAVLTSRTLALLIFAGTLLVFWLGVRISSGSA